MVRGLMVVLALAATAVQAQGRSRILVVPFEEESGASIPEVWVTAQAPTTLHLPQSLDGGGFALTGAEGRLSARRAAPDVLVLQALQDLGSEPIPLWVTTADGREYRFLLRAGQEQSDAQVTVVLGEPREPPLSEATLTRAIVQMLLDPEPPRVRSYEPPRPTRREGREAWRTAYLQMAIRRGDQFFLQVVSNSPEPWSVQQALLEGQDGKALIVKDVQSRRIGNWNYSVVQAEVPEGVSANYVLSSIRLVGHDLRVAVLGGEVLP